MKKYIGLAIILFSVQIAIAQIQYGVGIDVFQTKLNSVDRKNFTGYGFSVPGFKQSDKLGFGANYFAIFPISKNFNLETGAGISHFRSQFHFDYIHQISQTPIKATLNIALFYIKIPLLLSYNIPLTPKSKINIAGGFNTRFKFAHKDNFNEIIYEFINLPTQRYNPRIVSYHIGLGYDYTFKDNRKVRLEAIAGYDSNYFTVSHDGFFRWGFYGNLVTAHYSNYGMSLKYFFTK